MKIYTSNDKNIRRVAKDVTEEEILNGKYVKLLNEGYDFVKRPQGISLNQLGVNKRAAIVRLSNIQKVIYNPEILRLLGRRTSLEGCESVTGYYKVKRPLFAKIAYTDENNKRIVKWYRYKHARVLCHEIDHMMGVLICDKGKYWIGNGIYESKFKGAK